MTEPFGAYLKRIRESRGLTLRDVEKLSEGGLSNAYLSQIENGKIDAPSVVILHRLSAVYAIDFGDLCERACVGSRPPPSPPLCPTCGQVVRQS